MVPVTSRGAAGSQQNGGRGVRPVPDADVADFVRALRALKVAAGKPSFQELQRRTRIARSTLADALNVQRRELPRLEVCLALVSACGGGREDLVQWRAEWLRIAQLRESGADPLLPATAPQAEPARSELPQQSGAAPSGRRFLPLGLRDFTAREAEHAAILTAIDRTAPGSPTVLAIDGMAGVGKTALAVQIGHSVAGSYPDGQYYLDLHAHTAGRPPVAPDDALDALLRASGQVTGTLPRELDERAGLWRAVLADQRALVVLDNAATAEQVRPLLPGAGSALVLITSRQRLVGLDAASMAASLSLDVLSAEAGALLFGRVLGPRADAEPDAVRRLVALCGYLPLAIRIAAARLRHRPTWTVEQLADRLGVELRRLDELTTADLAVAAVFETSFPQLPAAEGRAFTLLGLHPGTDIDAAAAGALFGRSSESAERSLEALLDGHLLEQHRMARYTLHDLLRIHGANRAAGLPVPEREAALRRLVEHYLFRAGQAMNALYPQERLRRPQLTPPAWAAAEFADSCAAVRWLDEERANLVSLAGLPGLPQQIIDLSATVARYLERGAYGAEALLLHGRALSLAQAEGATGTEAGALRFLGLTHLQLQDYSRAHDMFQQALSVLETIEDDTRADGSRSSAAVISLRAVTFNNLGATCGRMGRLSQARDHFERAWTLGRSVGDSVNEALALVNLGLILRRLGRFEEALQTLQQALELHQRMDNKAAQSISHDNLGVVHRLLGHHEDALTHHKQALALDREANDRVGEAITMDNLGLVLMLQGDLTEALEHFERSLELSREIGDLANEGLTLGNLGTLMRLRGELSAARELHGQALTLFRDGNEPPLNLAEALNNLGETSAAIGDPAQAQQLHQEALDLATASGDPVEIARSRELLGNVLHTVGDESGAQAEHELAVSAYRRMGLPRAESLAARGCC